MSLAEIERAVLSIEGEVKELLDATFVFGGRLTNSLDKIDAVISAIPGTLENFTRIQQDIDHIDYVLGITLIVTLIICVLFFAFWFFTHVWPMIAGEHKHKHDLKHILRDLGTTSSRIIS